MKTKNLNGRGRGRGRMLKHVLLQCELMYDEYAEKMLKQGRHPPVSDVQWLSLLSEIRRTHAASLRLGVRADYHPKSESKRAKPHRGSGKY
jgi:hypothetical protein